MSAALVPFVVLAALLGLAVGSFLNVVIYRVPRGESVISPGSHCPNCDAAIKNRHNVPVFGWLMLRGRCADCHEPISARYPLVEAATAVAYAAVTAHFGLSAQLPAFLYLATIGIALAMIDLDVRHLPDSLVVSSYLVSILLLVPAAAVQGDFQDGIRALIGCTVLLGVFFAMTLAYPPGLSFSDVKLAGLLGLYLGWLSWSALLFAACAAVLIVGVALPVTSALRDAHRDRRLPAGSCLIAAAALALFATAPITQLYTSFST